MDKEMFRITLQGAVAGNHGDFEKIIELYAPLIDKHCYINGKHDPDLRQSKSEKKMLPFGRRRF